MAKRQSVMIDAVAVVSEEETLVRQAGAAVTDFLAQVPAFFRKARQIEDDALVTLKVAEALLIPTSVKEDEERQWLAKRTSAAIKDAEAHWDITKRVTAFRDKLSQARARPVAALTEANTIANRHHNAWVQAERDRIAEQRRLDEIEAQRKQEAIRAQELADMEAAAIKAEEGSGTLSGREREFVDLIATGVYAPERCAALAKFKDAKASALRLLALPKITIAIEAVKTAAAIRQQAEAVKRAPLDPVSIPERREQIAKVPGASDRTTQRIEIFDEAAFIKAVISNAYGISHDVLTFKQAAVNAELVGRGDFANRVPGCRLVKNTKVV